MYGKLIFVLTAISYTASHEWITYGKFEYLIVEDNVTQPVAEQGCRNMSATLVTIYNQTVQDFLEMELRQINKTFSFWIGLERTTPNDTFHWIDGTSSEFDFWNHENETLQNETCVTIGFPKTSEMQPRIYKWFTFSCNWHYQVFPKPGYVCYRNSSFYLGSTITMQTSRLSVTTNIPMIQKTTNQLNRATITRHPSRLTTNIPKLQKKTDQLSNESEAEVYIFAEYIYDK